MSSQNSLSKGSSGKSNARVGCWVLQGILPAGGEMGFSRSLSHDATLASTPPQALAGKCALVLCSHREITEQFSVSYCSKTYKIRYSAVISESDDQILIRLI